MEAVIFMGIQATGKSTFYLERFFKTHIRINLDMLKTRHRERLFLECSIEAKQPFVIDNTNPCFDDRKRYIELAKAAGFQVVGYYFQSVVKEALSRNEKRSGIENVPVPAILGTYKKLQLPRYNEGFDQLYYVKIEENGIFLIEEYKDEI